mmetsp:Transcript_12890/g.29165  ORF Transcript_12890/g.29165 Transcript_12890/m.29165 type:complete len:254 (+) Transcript_12890:426-1187(+)
MKASTSIESGATCSPSSSCSRLANATCAFPRANSSKIRLESSGVTSMLEASWSNTSKVTVLTAKRGAECGTCTQSKSRPVQWSNVDKRCRSMGESSSQYFSSSSLRSSASRAPTRCLVPVLTWCATAVKRGHSFPNFLQKSSLVVGGAPSRKASCSCLLLMVFEWFVSMSSNRWTASTSTTPMRCTAATNSDFPKWSGTRASRMILFMNVASFLSSAKARSRKSCNKTHLGTRVIARINSSEVMDPELSASMM